MSSLARPGRRPGGAVYATLGARRRYACKEVRRSMQVEQQPGESFEGLLRRFGRTIIKSGILGEAKRKRHYLSKGEARRAKMKASERKKRRKAAREAQRAAQGR